MSGNIVKFKPRQNACQHKYIIIDLDMRQLQCETCGANVDPIEWIYQLGVEEDILTKRIDSLKRELQKLQGQKAELRNKLNVRP